MDHQFFRNQKILRELLQERRVQIRLPSGSLFRWDLHLGDFRETSSDCRDPELVFYDFYSPKSSPELWGYRSFELLYQRTENRRRVGQGTTLITYCSSTSARAAMLLAGFFVGYGASTPAKKETTLATTHFEDLNQPLGKSWLDRWRRSTRPLTEDSPSIDLEKLAQFNRQSS